MSCFRFLWSKKDTRAAPLIDQSVDVVLQAAQLSPDTEAKREPDKTTWLWQFHQLLDEIQPVGSFASSGVVSCAPIISVKEVGWLKFPFKEASPTIAALKVVSTYRKRFFSHSFENNPKSDHSMRRNWEIETQEHVKIESLYFGSMLPRICGELGYPNVPKLNMEFYWFQLVVLGSGGKPSRDICHTDGLVGTVIILLPSHFTGGSLTVQNRVESKTFAFSQDFGDRIDQLQYIAFYAGCSYEIQPPTSGIHVYLVVSLVASGFREYQNNAKVFINSSTSELKDWQVKMTVPEDLGGSFSDSVAEAKDQDVPASELLALVKEWGSNCTAPRLGYQLDHKYRENDFGSPFLKGRDRQVFEVLRGAKHVTGKPLFDVYLVLLNRCYADKSKAAPNRDFRIHTVLDSLGYSVRLLFNAAGGGVTDGSICKDEHGWLIDAKYFQSKSDATVANPPFLRPCNYEAQKTPTVYYESSGYAVPDPYYPAAIFIAPTEK